MNDKIVIVFVVVNLLLVFLGFFFDFYFFRFRLSKEEKILTFEDEGTSDNSDSILEGNKSEGNKSSENDATTHSANTESSQDTNSAMEIQGDEYGNGKYSEDQVRPYPIHEWNPRLKSIPINGMFKVWIHARVHVVNEHTRVVWACPHFIGMPIRFLVECRISDHLRDEQISIGDLVILEYNADQEMSPERVYTIVYISRLYYS